MKRALSTYIVLVTILIVAAAFRFYGLAWDGGYLFHPDERQILLVASRIQLPSSIGEFFSADSSLNPKFFAYGSFPIYLVRGLSALAPDGPFNVPARADFIVALGMLGRVLSGLFDLGTIVLILLLGRRLYSATVGLLAAAGVAVTVLHIQLSHFYAVDTLLTFLVVATMYLAARFAEGGKWRDAVLMGAAFGLAIATKITALPLIVPIVAAVVRAKGASLSEPSPTGQAEIVLPDGTGPASGKSSGSRPALYAAAPAPVSTQGMSWYRVLVKSKSAEVAGIIRQTARHVWDVRRTLAMIGGVALLTFVVTQPYALLDPVRYFGLVGTETLVARGWLDYPYTRQYAGTIPFLYQVVQSSVWGMGLPLGILAWGGSALFVWQWWRRLRQSSDVRLDRGRQFESWRDGFLLAWALVYFLGIGAQYTKYLRYLVPLLPFLYLMAAATLVRFAGQAEPRSNALTGRVARLVLVVGGIVVAVATFLYALSFASLYSREHPWLQISRWTYMNLPAGATIAVEHWDDLLPVPVHIGAATRAPDQYRIQTLPMYDPDDPTKLEKLVEILAASDYFLHASQRLSTTIPRLPGRYPISSRFYHLLFDGRLGFEPVAHARNDLSLDGVVIRSEPFGVTGLTVPGMLETTPPGVTVWNWGWADESFTVYDHPLPIVFKKARVLSSEELRSLLSNQ